MKNIFKKEKKEDKEVKVTKEFQQKGFTKPEGFKGGK